MGLPAMPQKQISGCVSLRTWPDLGTGLEKGVNFADLRGYGPTLFG